MALSPQNPEYARLLADIGQTLNRGRRQAASAVNRTIVETYWNIGKYIVDEKMQDLAQAVWSIREAAKRRESQRSWRKCE